MARKSMQQLEEEATQRKIGESVFSSKMDQSLSSKNTLARLVSIRQIEAILQLQDLKNVERIELSFVTSTEKFLMYFSMICPRLLSSLLFVFFARFLLSASKKKILVVSPKHCTNETLLNPDVAKQCLKIFSFFL